MTTSEPIPTMTTDEPRIKRHTNVHGYAAACGQHEWRAVYGSRAERDAAVDAHINRRHQPPVKAAR